MKSESSIGVWQDPFLGTTEELRLELSEEEKEKLRRFQRGERGGFKLERIAGARPNVLVIRDDKKVRFFLWVKGKKTILLHIMRNHKYERVPRNVYEFVFGEPQGSNEEKKLNYVSIDEPDDLTSDKNFDEKEIKFATCYNQDLIIYDEKQELVLAKSLPVLLHGDFGSGKSALARTMLVNAILKFQDVYPDKDFVYYSHLPDLVRYMFDAFLLDNANIATFIDVNRIKFLDTKGLVLQYGDADLKERRSVGLDEFVSFFVEQHKNEMKKLTPKQRKASCLASLYIHKERDALYDEFQIIAVTNNDDAYLALGAHDSNYADPEIRRWLVKATQNYLNHMRDHHQFDPCVTVWKIKEAPLAFFVGDEMQGAPFSVVKMASRLVEGGENLMFCCDANQGERRLSALPRIKSIAKENGSSFNVCTMPGSYRSPQHAMPLINAVIKMKQYINGGLHVKEQASAVESYLSLTAQNGSIGWFDVSRVKDVKDKLDANKTVYVIITPEAYVFDAKKVFGDDVPVYTPRQARGMEFSVIVFYRLMDEPLEVKNQQKESHLLSSEINSLILEMPLEGESAKHQPKPGKANPIYEKNLNDWVISFSRLVGEAAHGFVVEAGNQQQAGHLQAFIKKAIEKGQALVKEGDQRLAVGTNEKWEVLALKNIEQGHREQALIIYKRLGKTELELDQAIILHQENKQNRINHALNQSPVSVLVEVPVDLTAPVVSVPLARAAKTTRPRAPRLKKKQNKKLNKTSKQKQSTTLKQAPIQALVSKPVLEPVGWCDDDTMTGMVFGNMLIEEDKKNAWMSRIDSITPISKKIWVSQCKSGQLFFLEVISDDALAKALFGILLTEKQNKKLGDFIRNIFSSIEWLKPYDESHAAYSRLHWMMEDSMRSMVFKNAVKMMDESSRLINFHSVDLVSALCSPYQSNLLNTRLSLISLIAVKHLDLLIDIYKAYPAWATPIMNGLLATFQWEGKATNAVQQIRFRRHSGELDRFDQGLLAAQDDLLYKKMIGFEKKGAYVEPLSSSLVWCLEMENRRQASVVMSGDRPELLASIMTRIDSISFLNMMMNNQKTFIHNIMFSSKTRALFFNLFVSMLSRCEKDSSVSVLVANMRVVVDFGMNVMVEHGETRVPLITAIFLSPHRESLLRFFEGDNPFQFYQAKVDIRSLNVPIEMPPSPEAKTVMMDLVEGCSSRLPAVLSSNGVSGLTPGYWLDARENEMFSRSFLSAILCYVNDDCLNAKALIIVNSILVALFENSVNPLLQMYIQRYFFDKATIPCDLKGVNRLLNRGNCRTKQPRALFDACFYLAWRFDSKMTSVIHTHGQTMLEALSFRELFDSVAVKAVDMSLFYFVIHHDAMLDYLINLLKDRAGFDASSYTDIIYNALTHEDISEVALCKIAWSALVRLTCSQKGLTLLCDLIEAFPGLVPLLNKQNFICPVKDTYNDDLILYSVLIDYSDEYNRLAKLISQENGALHVYMLEVAIQGLVGFQNVYPPIDSDSESDSDALPVVGGSPLLQNSLFNGNPSASSFQLEAVKPHSVRRISN